MGSGTEKGCRAAATPLLRRSRNRFRITGGMPVIGKPSITTRACFVSGHSTFATLGPAIGALRKTLSTLEGKSLPRGGEAGAAATADDAAAAAASIASDPPA